MTRVFVSHAAKDKPLVSNFVDLLHAGVNIQPNDIFCTSLEGMGIPLGQPFVDYIKSKLQKPEVVLLLISENYLASQFCIQEASAAWVLSLPIYPFLVPPVNDGNLTAVLAGRQAGRIDERADLNYLRDDLIEKLQLQPLRTAHWEAKREKFLGGLKDGLLSPKPPPDKPQNPPSPPDNGSTQPIPLCPAPSRPAIETLEERFQQTSQQRFTFLLIGQTGVGKSSTVNSLFNEEIAPVGHENPTTLKVKSYRSKIQQNITVIDTPGLCDDLGTKGNDKLYLSEIRTKVPEFHCCWFVTPLHETRLRPDERRAIGLITQAFGEEVWERSIIIFTFADYIPAAQYPDKLLSRSRMIRRAIREYTSSGVSNNVPAVAVSNVSPSTPDGSWYEELFAKVSDRIAAKQALPFVLTIIKKRRKLSLNSQQKETVRSAIRRSKTATLKAGDKREDYDLIEGVIAGGVAGAALGGLPGAIGGGLLGGLVGLFGLRSN